MLMLSAFFVSIKETLIKFTKIIFFAIAHLHYDSELYSAAEHQFVLPNLHCSFQYRTIKMNEVVPD